MSAFNTAGAWIAAVAASLAAALTRRGMTSLLAAHIYGRQARAATQYAVDAKDPKLLIDVLETTGRHLAAITSGGPPARAAVSRSRAPASRATAEEPNMVDLQL